jgi:hypothetical protein
MKNIELRTLSPLDIVVTKIGRLDQRDKEDIAACIRKFGLTKEQVAERAKQVSYVGREENYEINLKYDFHLPLLVRIHPSIVSELSSRGL